MFTEATKTKKYFKILIYGASGRGKTHFALTFPRCVVIDTESGTDFFVDRMSKFYQMKTISYREVKEAVGFLLKNHSKFDTLVIDSITNVYNNLKDGLQKVVERRAIRNKKDIEEAAFTQREWGLLKNKFKSMMTQLYNLPMHVIITAWEKPLYEEDKKTNELKKSSFTFEADKSVEFQPDIVIRIIVEENGKRFGIIEKDRTGTYATKERIPNPTYDSFKNILERFNNCPEQKITETIEDAIKKDIEELTAKKFNRKKESEQVWGRIKKLYPEYTNKEGADYLEKNTGKKSFKDFEEEDFIKINKILVTEYKNLKAKKKKEEDIIRSDKKIEEIDKKIEKEMEAI